MGSCSSKLQHEIVYTYSWPDPNAFKPTYQAPQNNLSRVDLFISNYARSLDIESIQEIPNDIINLCWIYYGKRRTKIFIAGHIVDIQKKSTSKLSLQSNACFHPLSFCYVPNIEKFIEITSSNYSNTYTYDGILAISCPKQSIQTSQCEGDEHQLNLLLFDSTSSAKITKCVQIHVNVILETDRYLKLPEILSEYTYMLYCGKYGIVTDKGTLSWHKNSKIDLRANNDRLCITMNFKKRYYHKYTSLYLQDRRDKRDGSILYLHDREVILQLKDYNHTGFNSARSSVILFDLKRDAYMQNDRVLFDDTACPDIYGRPPPCAKIQPNYSAGENFTLLQHNGNHIIQHSSCYDGRQFVYIVSSYGYLTRYNLDLNTYDAIFVPDEESDFYLIGHKVWMENENVIYCTDGRKWMYININDKDKNWILFDVDLGIARLNKNGYKMNVIRNNFPLMLFM